MSTEFTPCTNCGTQIQTVRCDNCRNVIPNDQVPAVSGRVWDPASAQYLPITLCSNCEDLPLKILAVAVASNGNTPT